MAKKEGLPFKKTGRRHEFAGDMDPIGKVGRKANQRKGKKKKKQRRSSDPHLSLAKKVGQKKKKKEKKWGIVNNNNNNSNNNSNRIWEKKWQVYLGQNIVWV